MEYIHVQLGGLPCKHQLAKPQYFDPLQSHKHIQSVAKSCEPLKHTIPYEYLEYSTDQHGLELGTKHSAIVIMKCLFLLGKHGCLPNPGLDYIFTF